MMCLLVSHQSCKRQEKVTHTGNSHSLWRDLLIFNILHAFMDRLQGKNAILVIRVLLI
jgi:hypothetical protein